MALDTRCQIGMIDPAVSTWTAIFLTTENHAQGSWPIVVIGKTFTPLTSDTAGGRLASTRAMEFRKG